MGKGKYMSNNTNESVMYWTTDHGFDVDISPFIKSEKEEKTPHGWMCHVWRATVTFGTYSYELSTSHFNMNILADDIKQHLIEQHIPDFSYCIDGYNELTEQYYTETKNTLNSALDRKQTRYNPVKDEYVTTYVLRDEHFVEEATIQYTHIGDPSDYIQGDFTKEVLKYCKHDRYPIQGTKIRNHYQSELKDIFSSPWAKVKILKTYYSISTNSYFQKFQFHEDSFEVEYCGDPSKKEIRTNIKAHVSDKYPEYIL